MRILLCSLEPPLGRTNGLTLLVDGTLRALRSTHDVRLLAYGRAGEQGAYEQARMVEPPQLVTIAAKARALAEATARRQPWQAVTFADGLRRPVREEIARFEPDVVHVVSGRLAGLGDVLADVPTVLSAIDAWHLNADAATAAASGARRLFLAGQGRLVRRFEATAFRRFDRVAVITERDRDALLEVAPGLRVVVVPHGIDMERFTEEAARGPRRGIVFHGVLSYPPNIDAACRLAGDILPLVQAAVPEASVTIVGRDPAERVTDLADLPGVTVTGEVDDVRPWLTSASVYVCPMRAGGGLKNKLLEAMASGTACVATRMAVEGLDVRHDEHVLISDDDDELAAATVRILREPAVAARLAVAARQLVETDHVWSSVNPAYTQLYGDILVERADVGAA
jgi:glycosyltransferase involved in cell wall biosynthesis